MVGVHAVELRRCPARRALLGALNVLFPGEIAGRWCRARSSRARLSCCLLGGLRKGGCRQKGHRKKGEYGSRAHGVYHLK
jgi:hypothetical protein